MRLRVAVLSLPLVSALACGEDGAPPPAAPTGPPATIAGMYEVEGVTMETSTGNERRISGTVILTRQGDAYTATYDLSTEFPTGEGSHAAEVIGKGWGSIEGRTLRGEAHTQVVMASVPGVDPGFAYIPRTTTTRIVSTSVSTVAPDGSLEIEIANTGAEGESYTPTRTVLRGRRVSAAGIGGGSEKAAAVD